MNTNLEKHELAVLAGIKIKLVSIQKYQLAAEIRNLETDSISTKEEVYEKYKKIIENAQTVFSNHENPSLIGSSFPVSKKAGTEAKELFEKAGKLRSEAQEILARANDLSRAAFEVLKKDNQEIPGASGSGLAFVFETNSVILTKI